MNVGIIGGSGLYEWNELTDTEWLEVNTPYGAPSDLILRGSLRGHTVFFIPRHGRGHRLLPSEINHRANIFALKRLGVEQIISITAVGSLQEDISPCDVVIPDQYFDRTRSSDKHTFFGNGLAAHVSMADPVCPVLHAMLSGVASGLLASAEFSDRRVHRRGTYVNMEGPAFSTRAESEFYQAQGFHVIGMTSLPEAKLAREAQLCYAALALVTDYDCWHRTEAAVTADLVRENVMTNIAFARKIILTLLDQLPDERVCPCQRALDGALMTDPAHMPEEVIARWNEWVD